MASFVHRHHGGLVCGTANGDPRTIIPLALRAGYRHFDGALAYQHGRNYNYLQAFRAGLGSVPRETVTITFKADHLQAVNMNHLLQELGLEYIDTFLIHHHYEDAGSYTALTTWLEAGQIHAWGVSNCETIADVQQYASQRLGSKQWPCALNQLQISAPRQQIMGRTRDDGIIEYCHQQGLPTMLFSPISGVTQNVANWEHLYPGWAENVLRYWLQKYIWNTQNYLLVGTVSGSSLDVNQRLFQRTDRMHAWQMDTIATWLEQKILLQRM